MVTTKWSEVRGRAVPADQEEAAAEGRRALRDALGLARIRAERQVTQVELAARLDRSQGNISELERRSDVYLSSLREYVEALGGELEVNAVFDGKRHLIVARR
jgi:DNA-binding XRE family transcriptional regulator